MSLSTTRRCYQIKFIPEWDKDFDTYTVESIEKALDKDLHSLLLCLSENEFEIWKALKELLNYYLNALEKFGSEVSKEEKKHASDAYRCVCACVIESNILREFRAAGDSFLSSLLADDHDFCLVYALWRWCIDSAISSSGFAELGRQVENINELVASAKSDMKQLRAARNLAADPDSILKAADDPNFEKYIRIIFSLIRCGKFEDAVQLSGTIGVPWMNFLIRTQHAMRESPLVSVDITEEEKAQWHAGKQTFQIMKAFMEGTNTSGVRMVFAALIGDVHYLLPLATNMEDRLWCYANAAVQKRLMKKMERELGIDRPDRVFTPTTVDGIFEAVAMVETSPYYVLMNYMMRESWSEAVEWMYSYCKKVDNKPGVNLSPLHRFFGLVVSICRILKYDHEELYAKDLLSSMIEAMLQRELFSLTPFYASLLPKDDALTKIWCIMPYVREERDRKEFIKAMNDAGFDGDDIAVRFGRFRMLEDVDHLDLLRWVFVSGDDKLLYAVAEANTVIRNYLLIDYETEANAVVNECRKLKLIDRLALWFRNRDSNLSNVEYAAGIAIDEFNNHCLCLSALAHCTALEVEARAQAAARIVAEHEHSDILESCEARSFNAVMAFLQHLGWRSATDIDWSRAEQLRLLRERYYSKTLNLLLRNFGMCDDATAILDLLPILADEELKLYEDLTREDLKQILLDVHTLAGHAIEQ